MPAILEALTDHKIECRVYDKGKFHAKAYITHAKMEVVGSQALVGSSNFTKPGLTNNIELKVQIQSAREVAQLQEWYEEHWNQAVDVTDEIGPERSKRPGKRLFLESVGIDWIEVRSHGEIYTSSAWLD